MKKFIKRKLVELLVLAIAITAINVNVMAENCTTVDIGTFYVISNNRNDGEEDPGNVDPGDIDHPINDDPENDDPENDDPENGDPENDDPGDVDHPINDDTGSTSANNMDPVSANKKAGSLSGDRIAQAPTTGDVITEKKTVVATKTKWRITPSFNVMRATSSDRRGLSVLRKKDRTRSSLISKWYCCSFTVKKPGTYTITLEGNSGEKEEYLIYAEDPKVKKNALTVNDVKTISMDSYISGIRYLKPTYAESKRPDVATVSEDGSIRITSGGKTRVTLYFGKRKVKGTVKAMLPTFTKKQVTLGSSPMKLTMKNVSDNSAVRYSSSDISVVKMNKDGYAAPLSNGTATVFGRSGNVTAECEVTVRGLK